VPVSASADLPRPRTDEPNGLVRVPDLLTPQAPDPAPRPVRASDAERERTVRALHEALGEGRLDLQETELRVAAAYATVHRAELGPLLDDLPPAPTDPLVSGPGAPSWQTLWTATVWRARSSFWDGVGTVGGGPGGPVPGPGERRLALIALLLAGLWLMICAVVGAMI
jgi:hypothetical protein